jgi:pyridinium-3,5-bisthiocarboxylic acid mononucleotide nickel chelatase
MRAKEMAFVNRFDSGRTPSAMKIAYFDCFSGLSGDMTLGALLACGADENAFRNALEKLRVPGYNLHIRRRKVEGLMATDVDVELLEADQGHGRHLSDIAAIYADSDLPPRVRENAFAIFTRLAEAEAKVHGTTPDEIHFHEVGAVDAIVDITGACILLDMLGVEAVYASPLPMSRGFVDCQHGRMPLPAPATMELLMGLPAYPVPVKGELVTPTGAAIVATLAGPEHIGEPPAMIPRAVGYGSGKKDFGAPFPNLLRVVIGEVQEKRTGMNGAQSDAHATPTTVVVLETNVDDASPEVLGYTQERLLAQGALDVFFVPAQMKKNRPGTLVTVLAAPETAEMLTDTLLAETGTFGVRRTVAERTILTRSQTTVDTVYGPVRVKVGMREGRSLVASPEYEDCRDAAVRHTVPLREVYSAARTAAEAVAASV